MNKLSPARAAIVAGIPLAVVVAATAAMQGPAGAGNSPPTQRPGADQVIDQFQKNEGVFPGYRRNHAKGVCVSGYFHSSGKAARYSTAQVFASGQRTPVIGRLSIPGTSPYAWDGSTPIRGMALALTQANGEQWRTAMNAVPAFPVSTPAADYEFMKLQQPDSATGDPDPKKLAAFFATHPTANAFRIWDETTKPSTSYATVRYNSLDAFEFVDARGWRHAVRWSMLPESTDDGGPIPADDPDYLAADLRRRLSHAPLRWRLSITLANPGDAINDAARAWTGVHRHIDAGTLVIEATRPQENGPCRDINFNPLVLPTGIEPSDDPLLRFRAEAYAESHRRRVHEEDHRHTSAKSGGS
ncbi:MAG TPA: catalase family peroxidase [Rhodanobacteraceae bacterium]|nr:catalase family peroxidase [Rhodanobacteraceae bacterium]